MLNELKIDELLGKVDSRYGLVLVAARRAREINEYAATLGLNDSLGIPGPQVHTRSQHPLSISFEELRSNKLDVSYKKPPKEADEEALPEAADAGDAFLDPPSGAGAVPDTAPDTADTEDVITDEPASTGGAGEGAA